MVQGSRTASTPRCSRLPARAGTRNAILDHTYADAFTKCGHGKPVGELGLNAGLAGVHGGPSRSERRLRPRGGGEGSAGDGVATVIVKEAVSRHAAKSVAPRRVPHDPRGGPAALKRKHVAFTLGPVTLEVDSR